MPKRKQIYAVLFFLFLTSLILVGVFYYSQSQKLKVVFLDVGQGDAILIEEGSKQILIDGGPDGQKLTEKLGQYIPFWDRNIEVMITTHPDQDHIEGLIDAIRKYNVSEYIDNGVTSDTQVYRKLQDEIGAKNIHQIEGMAGFNIAINPEAKLEIIYPDGTQAKDNPKDTNATSIVSKLTCAQNSFLFTGDFPVAEEQKLIQSTGDGNFLKAEILKVSHHGSKYATSDEFLNAVSPKEAVISVGKNNRYGHPNQETLDRLSSHGVKILRTDEVGDIEYVCQ